MSPPRPLTWYRHISGEDFRVEGLARPMLTVVERIVILRPLRAKPEDLLYVPLEHFQRRATRDELHPWEAEKLPEGAELPLLWTPVELSNPFRQCRLGAWACVAANDHLKSATDFLVVSVREDPGYTGSHVTRAKDGRVFRLLGKIHTYRAEARAERRRILANRCVPRLTAAEHFGGE